MSTGFLLIIGCGVAGGMLFQFLHIPGGAMLGAVIGSMTAKLSGLSEAPMPENFQLIAQIGIGIMVGNMITVSVLNDIKVMFPLMIVTTGLLLAAGFIGAWVLFRTTGMDIGSSILATSPGGMNAVVGMATDLGTHAPMVMAFQLVRLYTVILLAPFLSFVLTYWSR